MDSSSSGNVAPDKKFNDITGGEVSHAPLDLGGADKPPVPKVKRAVSPAAPVGKGLVQEAVFEGRVSGVKTFFTKLHSGAIEFLDEQITRWLNENPDIVIKHTNVITGEIQGKKTEPNIIITVWFKKS